MAICAVKWCDFFVYVGEDHFLQRVVFDQVFSNEKLLPKLLHVYSTAAIPYLEGLGRDTAVSVHVPQLADSMEQFENLLQGELCQSRIGGRNGSNACTIICSVFVQKFLSHSAAHCLTGQTAAVELKTLMCDSMSSTLASCFQPAGLGRT